MSNERTLQTRGCGPHGGFVVTVHARGDSPAELRDTMRRMIAAAIAELQRLDPDEAMR